MSDAAHLRLQRLIPVGLLALSALLSAGPVRAQADETPRERDLYNYGSARPKPAVDITNPMSIMTQLRNLQTAEDATPPGDAIDAALKEFETSSAPTKLVPVSP